VTSPIGEKRSKGLEKNWKKATTQKKKDWGKKGRRDRLFNWSKATKRKGKNQDRTKRSGREKKVRTKRESKFEEEGRGIIIGGPWGGERNGERACQC